MPLFLPPGTCIYTYVSNIPLPLADTSLQTEMDVDYVVITTDREGSFVLEVEGIMYHSAYV